MREKEETMIVTTTPTVEGMPIVEYKGLVSATAIHGIHIGKDFMAAGRNLVGGRSKTYEDELDKGQSEAMAEMEKAAADLGANAIVGVTLDIEALGNAGNMLMVSVTGTAVVVR
jgi:uncharacterized protein YbjQ (UPF0145 family)